MGRTVCFRCKVVADGQRFEAGDSVPEADLHPDTVASMVSVGLATVADEPEPMSEPAEPAEPERTRKKPRQMAADQAPLTTAQERAET